MVAWIAMTGAVSGQVDTPLHIGATQSMQDEFGSTLNGNATSPGDAIQILWASNSVIYPPAIDGTPDPRNPIVEGGETAIGSLTARGLIDPGVFGLSLSYPRPGNGSIIFARAFNARTLANASFYGDSQLFTASGNAVFDAVIGGTTNALDPNDNDGDGLNNSWEQSLGSDPNNPDSDGDRMTDGDELRAGTDFLDPNSVFVIAQAWPAGDDMDIEWDAVPGKRYKVQYTTNSLAVNPQEYVDCSGVITATSGTAGTTITNGVLEAWQHFRIVLVEEQEEP